jgi:phosphoribosylanthranilate isomerase
MSLLVKICGLSTRETLDTALEAGADMVGFVFFPPSPRHLSLEIARELGRQDKGRATKVALTVDADDATLENIVEMLKPDLLQLHEGNHRARTRHQGEVRTSGHEGDCGRDGGRSPCCRAMPSPTASCSTPARPGRHLPRRAGGRVRLARFEKLDLQLPFMVSGGLSADNVAEASRHPRRRRRCVLRRRKRARCQGSR